MKGVLVIFLCFTIVIKDCLSFHRKSVMLTRPQSTDAPVMHVHVLNSRRRPVASVTVRSPKQSRVVLSGRIVDTGHQNREPLIYLKSIKLLQPTRAQAASQHHLNSGHTPKQSFWKQFSHSLLEALASGNNKQHQPGNTGTTATKQHNNQMGGAHGTHATNQRGTQVPRDVSHPIGISATNSSIHIHSSAPVNRPANPPVQNQRRPRIVIFKK